MTNIKTEQLIEEVKKRPGLYDKALDIDRDEKMILWKEVGAVVYKDWGKVSKAEAYDRVLELQRKWRSVRDALNRELRQRKPDAPKRKRKVYKYYRKLKFMLKDEDQIPDAEDDDDDNDDDEVYDPDIQSPRLESSQLTEEQEDSDPLVPRPPRIRVRRKMKKRTSDTPERQMVDIPPLYANEEHDGDRLFLLSFAPELSKLPSHINMWARAEIANIMQQAVNCYFNNSIPGGSGFDADVKRQKINHDIDTIANMHENNR